MQTASELLGVPVPSDAPAFLMALGAHVVAGLTCVVAGAVSAFARKSPGIHPRAGIIYWCGLLWILTTSTVMAVLRWPHDTHLLVIGAVAFTSGSAGLIARFQRGRHWLQVHLVSMGTSYIALLMGFFVDNGPHLPLWRHLPPMAFWILPAGIGLPVIERSFRKYARRH
jgi:hypothetical protein